MSGGLIQIPIVKKACLAKQEWSTDAYNSLLVTIHYTLFDLLAIRYLETDITTCSLKLTILLSVTHVNRTHFSAIGLPLRKSQSRG